MKVQNQVCTLEQAVQLKALGVAQELSMFHYLSGNKRLCCLNNRGQYVDVNSGAHYTYWQKIAAFTVAELGEMVGSEVLTERAAAGEQRGWNCRSEVNHEVAFSASTEAEARAAMLIWLLEKGHRTAPQVNEALATT